MTPSPPTQTIFLDQRVTLTVTPKQFRHAYSYQAPIHTDALGRVSGGGTRGGSVLKPGFCLYITNNEAALRSYYFSVGIFTDHDRKIVRQTMPRHVAHVHPGHTMAVDIELADNTDYNGAYLIDFVISTGQEPLAHFTPDASLAQAAGSLGVAEGGEVDFFDALVGTELLLIGLTVGSMARYGMHWDAKWAWLLGLSVFFGGLYLMQMKLARMVLCSLIAIIWGLIFWQ